MGIEVLGYHSSASSDEGRSGYEEKMEKDNADNCRLKDSVTRKPLNFESTCMSLENIYSFLISRITARVASTALWLHH